MYSNPEVIASPDLIADASEAVSTLRNMHRAELYEDAGHDPDALVLQAYDTAVVLAEAACNRLDRTGATNACINRIKPWSRPNTAVLRELPNNRAGDHAADIRMLRISERTVLNPEGFAYRLARAGVKLQHLQDLSLLPLLHVAAHEAGHALNGGIALTVYARQREDYMYITATESFLSRHPEVGFTGNAETDIAIHEERFAEGIANIVLAEALSIMGYDAKSAKAIKKALAKTLDFSGEEGTNQIDYLKLVGTTETLAELVESADHDDTQAYTGMLGYHRPLSAPQVVEQLRDAAQQIDRSHKLAVISDDVEWQAQVRKYKTPRIRSYLAYARMNRYAALHPRQATVSAYATMVLSGMAVGSLIAYGIDEALWPPRESAAAVNHQNPTLGSLLTPDYGPQTPPASAPSRSIVVLPAGPK